MQIRINAPADWNWDHYHFPRRLAHPLPRTRRFSWPRALLSTLAVALGGAVTFLALVVRWP